MADRKCDAPGRLRAGTSCHICYRAFVRWARVSEFANWDVFTTRFRGRFCQEDEDAVTYRLQMLRQGPNQSARELADQIRALCGQIEHVSKKRKRNYFLRALRPELQDLVTAREPGTLQAAENAATFLEDMKVQIDAGQKNVKPATQGGTSKVAEQEYEQGLHLSSRDINSRHHVPLQWMPSWRN